VSGDQKLLACAALSVAGHFALARGLGRLPGQPDRPPDRVVSISVVPPPALAPPPPAPEAAPPRPEAAPRPVRAERLRAPRPAPVPAAKPAPREAPPPVTANATPSPAPTPVFGVTMQSTSQAGHGAAIPVGNTLAMRPGRAAPLGPAGPVAAAPVGAFEVTSMPLPQGRCAGAYTEDAKQAGVEGTVVLDLVVGDDGRTRDIHVVSGLPHGLSEAATAALRACRFTPGEKNGTRVSVRLRGFKIQFVLQNAS